MSIYNIIEGLLKDYQRIIEVKDVLKRRFQNFNVKISLQMHACSCTQCAIKEKILDFQPAHLQKEGKKEILV
jgi:hypothetical protein